MSSIQYQLKNPSSVVDDSFVFAYPMIFDTKLHKQHEEDIRTFFQLQFLNQIKNSNILKLINKKVYQTDYSSDSVPNPVENLENKLASNNKSSARNIGMTTKFNKPKQYTSDPYAQDSVDRVVNDLYKLIKYDPKFSDLNTIIDMIPVGHSEVFVPMVIGTKVSKIQTSSLFWILYFTLGHLGKGTHATLKLNNNSDLSKLKQIIAQVTSRNYEDYFGLPVSISNIKLSNQVDYREVSKLKSEMTTAIKRFENVMNENRFMEDLSMSHNSIINVSLSKTLNSSKQIRNSVLSQANAMFGSLMSNEVVPLLHSMVNMLMSADELSNDARTRINNTNNRFNPTTVSRFVEHIIGAFQSNTNTLFDHITSSIESNLIKSSTNMITPIDADGFFSSFASTCSNVSNISVENILQDISSANFSIVGASRDSVETFVEKLSKVSSQLRTHINYIENDIKVLSNDDTKISNFLKTYREQITSNLMSFMTGMVDDWKTVGFSDRLLGILGLRSQSFNTRIFILDLIDSITSIVTFLATYTYISYLCNYFSYVHATIEKTKGSAIEFPNYALVIDADIIRVLYLNLAVANYKVNVNNPGTKNVITNTNVTEQHLMNMIRTLQQKLEIPNLIVIDRNDIYYKFMFHRTNSIQKIGLGNLKSYNRHFKPTI